MFTFGLKGFFRPTVTDELKDLASSSGRALGALYALILALAFNTVMSEYSELEEAIDEEAILVAQILEDSVEEMDEATGREAVDDLVVYVDAVLNEEWKAKSAATVTRTADAALESLRTRLQPLETENPSMAAELHAGLRRALSVGSRILGASDVAL